MVNIVEPQIIKKRDNKSKNTLFKLLRRGLRGLSKIKRFSGAEMIVQDNVYIHTIRMYSIILFFEREEDLDLDFEYLKILCLIHDLPEIHTGDIPSPDKQDLSPQDRRKLEEDEKKFLERVRNMIFNKMNIQTKDKQKLQNIIFDLQNKETKEAKFLKLLDCIDAMMICIREVINGSSLFSEKLNSYLRKENKFSILNYIELNRVFIERSKFLLGFTDPSFLKDLTKLTQNLSDELNSSNPLNGYIVINKKERLIKKCISVYDFWNKVIKKYRIQTSNDFKRLCRKICEEKP